MEYLSHKAMPQVGFETSIPGAERSKTYNKLIAQETV
jgi:hypothetical protein